MFLVFLVDFLFAKLEKDFPDFQISKKRENVVNIEKAIETLDRRKTLEFILNNPETK